MTEPTITKILENVERDLNDDSTPLKFAPPKHRAIGGSIQADVTEFRRLLADLDAAHAKLIERMGNAKRLLDEQFKNIG